MNPPAVRLGRWHQIFLYSTSTVLVVSGALWLLFHHFVTVPGDFGPTIHPIEPWWMRIHGLGSALFLIGFGSVLPGHVRRAWQSRRNRFSGTSFFAVLGTLILTGYVLYYAGTENLRQTLSVTHWLLGLVFPVLIGWHVWRGRKSRHMDSPGALAAVSERSIDSSQSQSR